MSNTLLTGGFGSTTGVTVLSRGFGFPATPQPVQITRMGQVGAGRVRDGIARFTVGEQGDLYGYCRAAIGSYVPLSATFQLLDLQDVPLAPPYSSIDFTTPVAVTRLTPAADPRIVAFYGLDTTGIAPGDYRARFTLAVRTTTGDVDHIDADCLLEIRA